MSNYNKATNFAVKDTLTSGDPDKVVSGAEIDNEFNSIASAVTSKADKVTSATTDNFASLDANGNLKDSGFDADSVSSPAGTVSMFAGTSEPSGWLFCNGQNVNRSTYPNLFSAIGETFGAGDGSSTFGLPDLRDRFVIGGNSIGDADAGRISNYSTGLSDTGGEENHQLTQDEMPSHSHSVPRNIGGGQTQDTFSFNDDASWNGSGVNTSSKGGDQAHNNIPPFIAMNYIIKT